MRTIFLKKGDNTRRFSVENGVVLVTVEIAGMWVSNPTLSAMLADGWIEIIDPAPEPYQPTREEKINAEIRERYSADDEAQLVREKIAGKEGAEARFSEYNAYVESVLFKYPEDDE